MASGSQLMTTYYAKRIVGDASAAQANKALLQTGANVIADTWILNRTNRATVYGIKYVDDETNEHDKVELYGGSATASAWVQLDTGDAYISGRMEIGGTNDSYKLYVNGSARIDSLLTLYREGSTTDNKGTGIRFENKDTTTNQVQTAGKTYIFAYNTHSADDNGMNMVIRPGGNLFIGSGESAEHLYALNTTSTTENLYATADSTIYLEAGAQTIANRIGIAIDDNGTIIPVKAEAENNNAQNIGTNATRWKTGYFSTSLLVGAANSITAYNSNATGSFIGTGTISSCLTAAGGGYYLFANGVQYGRMYISAIGTANSGDGYATRGAQGYTTLQLGNSTPRPAAGTEGGADNSCGRILLYHTDDTYTTIDSGSWTGHNLTVLGTINSTANETGSSGLILGNANKKSEATAASYGYIRIYGEEANYHNIYPGAPNGNRSHYLPNATGWIVTGGNGTSTGEGDTDTPVYLKTDGTLAAITSYDGNAATATTWQTSRTLTVGATGKSVNGSANVSWSKAEILGSSTNANFYRGDQTWSNTLNGAFQANGTITANGGYLKSTANSNTITIGSQNGNWGHIQNSANISFYFNRSVHVDGDVYRYNTKVHMSSSGFHPPKNGGIYWDPYVESASDASDVTQIIQVASGAAGGTELRIQQANDATDIINLITPKSIYLNSKEAFNVSDAWLRINENKKFTSGVYFGTSVVRTDGEFWSDSVRIVDNWVGFYNGVQGATRYGYVQANADRMYFRKENGVSTYAFDFNGYIYTSGKLHVASQEDVGLNQNGAVVIGNKSGTNIGIDDNEIMARNNSAASTLYLNSEGGQVYTTWLHIQNDSSNNSDDATVLISCQTANDWGLKINKGGKNYGIRVDSLDQGEAIWTNGYVRARCVWANQGSNGERQVGVDSSTSGTLYLYANTSGKGLYSGSGYKTGSIISITSSAVTFNGNCSGSSGSCTGNAASATKLGTDAGNANTPVYFTGGKPSACNNKLGAQSANGYWGMGSADNAFNVWIRTTTLGIIPYQSGGKGSGHCGIGTSSWYFSTAYIDTITSNKTYGAVWNDIAECRKTIIKEPGRVVVENKSGIMELSSIRMQATGRIISDTYGYCMGEPANDGTPIAIAGRVLVYPYRKLEEYNLGDCVCSAPNGTVDIMTREEIKEYPDRIVGTVSEIPTYEIWSGGAQNGKDDIQVNGRIWIYVR